MRLVLAVLGAVFAANTAGAGEAELRFGTAFCTFLATGAARPDPALFSMELIALIMPVDARIAAGESDSDDRIPYMALRDASPTCRPARVVTANGDAEIEISHEFPEDSASDWSDWLIIKNTVMGMRINDIRLDSFGWGLREALGDRSLR